MYDWGGTFIHGTRRLCLQSAPLPLPLPLLAEAWVKDIWTLEAQEKQLRGKREELEVEAELAASRAKSEVFQAASEGSCSSWRPSNRTNTYLQRKEKQQFSCEGLKPGENSHSGHHVKLVKAMEVLKKKKEELVNMQPTYLIYQYFLSISDFFYLVVLHLIEYFF